MDNEPIEFRFFAFQVISKYMKEMPETGLINPVFTFEIKVEDKVQVPTKSVLIFVDVKIFDNQEKTNMVGSVKTVSFFEVLDFEKFIVENKDKKSYSVPIQLQLTIKPVAISTTRGVIHSEFRGTYLHTALMPVVFMNNFINIPEIVNDKVEDK